MQRKRKGQRNETEVELARRVDRLEDSLHTAFLAHVFFHPVPSLTPSTSGFTIPTAMAVDWSEYPEKFWHCFVVLEESKKGYAPTGVMNDLSIKQIRNGMVEPWREARPFSVGGIVVRSANQVARISIVQTPQPQQYYADRYEAEMAGRNRAANADRLYIPFWKDNGTDYTNEFLFSEAPPMATPSPEVAKAPPTKAFIVHGHDTAMLNEVALLLERLDIDEIILKDQANLSRTLIEKLEQESDVGYAIILFTPDDLGRAKDKKELKPRARQNAVLELGYFIGSLGRKNVCVLLVEGLDRPSDIDGVGYVAIDAEGAWKLKLAREMRAAGLPVDLNKLTT